MSSFTNEAGEILMVVPSYKSYLDLPGGYLEPGETPLAAARREVYEELSITPDIGQLLVVDWWTGGIEPEEGSKILFVFDGGSLSEAQLSEIAGDGKDVVDYRFVPMTSLAEVTVPRLANRLRHATEAAGESRTRYLECGVSLFGDPGA